MAATWAAMTLGEVVVEEATTATMVVVDGEVVDVELGAVPTTTVVVVAAAEAGVVVDNESRVIIGANPVRH